MLQTIILIGGFIVAFVGALLLASKNGSKAAQLEALKAELKKQAEEQARAKQTTDSVYSMDADTARKRLQEVANGQKRDHLQ